MLKRIEPMGLHSEVERLWIEEAKRRLEGYRRGDIEAVSGDEVMKRDSRKNLGNSRCRP